MQDPIHDVLVKLVDIAHEKHSVRSKENVMVNVGLKMKWKVAGMTAFQISLCKPPNTLLNATSVVLTFK